MTDNQKNEDFAEKVEQLRELTTPMEEWDPFTYWRQIDVKAMALKLQQEEADKKKLESNRSKSISDRRGSKKK